MNPPRYYFDGRFIHLDSNGDWCKWEDMAPLIERIKKLEEGIDWLNKEINLLVKDNNTSFGPV